jgi:hypothetical protein
LQTTAGAASVRSSFAETDVQPIPPRHRLFPALLVLFGAGLTATGSRAATLSRWVQYGADNMVLLRAITDTPACPAMAVDGVLLPDVTAAGNDRAKGVARRLTPESASTARRRISGDDVRGASAARRAQRDHRWRGAENAGGGPPPDRGDRRHRLPRGRTENLSGM